MFDSIQKDITKKAERGGYKRKGFHLPDKKNLAPYLFISPWLIGFLLLGIWPFLDTIYNSLTKYNLLSPPEWVGLDNYVTLFKKDAAFLQVGQNMVVYVTLSTIITIVGGLFFALLLNRKFPGNHFFRVILYVPSLLTGVATGMMFKQVFSTGEIGLANIVLGIFHIGPFNWLTDYTHLGRAMIAVSLVNLWYMGGTMLIFLAGLRGISPTYYEAAKIDGAGPFNLFRLITLPLLVPVLVFNTILALIYQLQVFEVPLTFAATNGSISTFGEPLGQHYNLGTFLTYIYVQGFAYGNFGYASALAIVVFALTMVLTMPVLVLSRKSTF